MTLEERIDALLREVHERNQTIDALITELRTIVYICGRDLYSPSAIVLPYIEDVAVKALQKAGRAPKGQLRLSSEPGTDNSN